MKCIIFYVYVWNVVYFQKKTRSSRTACFFLASRLTIVSPDNPGIIIDYITTQFSFAAEGLLAVEVVFFC